MMQKSQTKDTSVNTDQTDSIKEKTFVVTASQSGALIASTIIGVGVLTLPRTATELVHQAGWIPILIVGIISILSMYFIVNLGIRFPGKTIVQYTEELFSVKKIKWMGKIVSILIGLTYIVFWGAACAITVRTFGEVVVSAVLIRTPIEVTVSSMCLLVLIMAM